MFKWITWEGSLGNIFQIEGQHKAILSILKKKSMIRWLSFIRLLDTVALQFRKKTTKRNYNPTYIFKICLMIYIANIEKITDYFLSKKSFYL